MIATRMRNSDFKNALKALEHGAAVKLEGPVGSLTLHRAANRPAVFIAGGIGITPFISILRHASDEGSQRRFLLLYANRRPEDAPFLDELKGLSNRLPNFRMLATMTQPATSQRKWDGERGQVDARRLEQALADLEDPVYYLTGPPGMVEAMRELLEDAGASEEDIRSEEFFGY